MGPLENMHHVGLMFVIGPVMPILTWVMLSKEQYIYV